MTFLAPAFLAALAALVVPLIVHLRRRRQRRAVVFPSLMFVSAVPYRSLRRRRLRDLGLLALRCAAVVLAVTAFARPAVRGGLTGSGDGARLHLLLVDRSLSMALGDRWERARQATREVIQSAERLDRFALLAFSEDGVDVVEPTSDGDAILARLEDLGPDDGRTRLAPALRQARTLLDDEAGAACRLLLISDFRLLDDEIAPLSVPPTCEVEGLDVATPGDDAGNRAIAELSLERSAEQDPTLERERVEVVARVLAPRTGEREPAARAELLVAGRSLQTVDYRPEGGVAEIRFEPYTVEEGEVAVAEVRLGADALTEDSSARAILRGGNSLEVLLVETGGRRRADRYLSRAVATSRSPRLRLRRVEARSLAPRDLEGASVVLVHDALDGLSADAAGWLEESVTAGVGLLVALGPGTPDGGLGTLVPPPEEERRSRLGRHIAFVDLDHPSYSLFREARGGGFGGARFFRYRPPGGPGASGIVLLRADDGAPLLVERRVGRGRVQVLASTLDGEENDLVLQSFFVPWLDRTLRHLAGFDPPRAAYRVGDAIALDLGRLGAAPGDPVEILTPAERRSSALATEAGILISAEEAGVYEVRVEGAIVERLAVNVRPEEVAAPPLDVAETLAAWFPRAGETETAAGGGSSAEQRSGQLWWLLLAAGGFVLLAETVVARSGGRGAGKVTA